MRSGLWVAGGHRGRHPAGHLLALKAAVVDDGKHAQVADGRGGAGFALSVQVTPRENSGNLGWSKAGNRGWVWRAATETSLSSTKFVE